MSDDKPKRISELMDQVHQGELNGGTAAWPSESPAPQAEVRVRRGDAQEAHPVLSAQSPTAAGSGGTHQDKAASASPASPGQESHVCSRPSARRILQTHASCERSWWVSDGSTRQTP